MPQLRHRVFFVGFRAARALARFEAPAATHRADHLQRGPDAAVTARRQTMGVREALGLTSTGADALAPTLRSTLTGARRTMEANRRTDTSPERALRSALHARGLRFRKDRRLEVGGRHVRPDIVFGPSRVAVFVDGCFWHRCPVHSTHPRANEDFWQAKFERNVIRDRADDAALERSGWTVVRVWEHENPTDAADRVEAAIGEPNTRSRQEPSEGPSVDR